MIKFYKLISSQLHYLLMPILVSLFPILIFYLQNISILSEVFLFKFIIYSVVLSLILTNLIYIFIKNKEKTSIISTIIIFIFFSYGHLSNFLTDKLYIQITKNLILGPDKILLPIILIAVVFVIFKVLRSKSVFNREIKYISIIFTLLITYNSMVIFIKERNRDIREYRTSINIGNSSKFVENKPDIYFIILDGYARQDILNEIYDYDNSVFVNKLKDMGFYVADQARSNYIHTFLSLPSTLNMKYLEELPEKYGKKPIDESAAINLIHNNLVTSKLKSYGYTTINFPTWWSGTNENYPADIIYNYDKNYAIADIKIITNETNMVFLQTTLLSPLIKDVWGDVLRGKILTVFQKLPDIPYLGGNKFVIAHVTAPHPPYLFTSSGENVQGSEFENADEGMEKRSKYIEQLTFVSNQILPVIQKIIKNSEKPPIIILQSDHGPASIFGKREEWQRNYSPQGIEERSSILFAVYFPDKNYKSINNSITPINTFRILFNQYFGENNEILPDIVYYSDYNAIYDFKDITNSY